MSTTKTPTTFKPGQQLSARSLCDHNCIYTATVIKRTEKTVTIEEHGKRKTVKIHADSYGDHCYPHGHYSMCAIFRAPADVPSPAPLPEWMEELAEEQEAAPFEPVQPEAAPEPENVVQFQKPAAPAPAAPERAPIYEDKPRHYSQQRMCFDESDLFALR